MRSMTADSSVKNQKLKAGTVHRIFLFAKPYKWQIIIFLVTVVIDAFLMVASPLLLRRLIDDGVIPKNGHLVTRLAIAVGLICMISAHHLSTSASNSASGTTLLIKPIASASAAL